MRGACPCEPEEADREEEGADDHGDQSLLRYRFPTVFFHSALKPCVGVVDYDGDTEHHAED